MLKVTVTGAATGAPPLLIAHGLFGSARNWGVIAKRLSERRQVLAVDMRNHGDSPRASTQGYGEMAADLAEVIAAHGGRADVLGHSMGGKAAMRLALEHPELVRRLVVADIAPVAYGHSQSHLIRAMRGLDLEGVVQRSEADRRLAVSVEDPGVRAFLLQSLDLKAQPPRWRLNLDVLEAEMDRITGWEEVPGRFEGPTLFLSGALSSYVLPEHRERIRALFPRARFARIPGAGHWLHAERPREFEAAVATFLDAPGEGD
jgi:pimeloyl-ACP methyl ester carboxylesterase